MNHRLLVVMSPGISKNFKEDIVNKLKLIDHEIYKPGVGLRDRAILMVSEVNDLGYDLKLLAFLESINQDTACFEGSVGGVIVKSASDLYTKSFGQNILFQFNQLGLAFLGHGVVEITKDYGNFETWQKTMHMSLRDICLYHCSDLIKRLMAFEKPKASKILALHSSASDTSNTLGLWRLVKKDLGDMGLESQDIHIENGTVVDCKGCAFQTCMHYGKNKSCFYGGIMVEEVLPAIEVADVLVWICPNYNDSISANLLAVINRLTVLYRQMSFHDKAFYAVVVSGNSGSDAVAKQLIGALNINKGFYLPGHFVIMATANAPLKVLTIDGIHDKAQGMADQIYKHLDGGQTQSIC